MGCTDCSNCTIAPPSRGIPEKGISPIVSLFYIVTESCNLRCRYCFVKQRPKFMSTKLALDATKWLIQQAEVMGQVPKVNFFGGEPLLCWDSVIVPVTEYVRKEYGKPFSLAMTSNGILLDEAKVAYMRDNQIGLLFSIDGPKDVQDLNRPLPNGGSSFDILEPKIPMILEQWPHMTFRSTFDTSTVDSVVRIHEFAVSKGYDNIFCIPNNLEPWSDAQLDLMRQQLHALADYWMDLLRDGKLIEFNPFCRAIRDIADINTAARQGIFRSLRDNKRGYGKCGVGGTGFASVTYNGDLYSCQELVSHDADWAQFFKIGNIYTGVDDEHRVDMLKQFDVMKIRSSKNGRCAQCMRNSICDGACIINNILANGTDCHVLPEVSCIYYEVALQEMIRVMNTMAAENNLIFKEFFRRMMTSTEGR